MLTIIPPLGFAGAGSNTVLAQLDIIAAAGGDAAHVATGDPLPLGADTVVRTEETRPAPNVGPPREVA